MAKATSLTLSYESRQSVVPSRADLEDVSLAWSRRTSPAAALYAAVFYGLSDTAEDWGASFGVALTRSP